MWDEDIYFVKDRSKAAGLTALVVSLAALPILLFCVITHMPLLPGALCYAGGAVGTIAYVYAMMSSRAGVRKEERSWIIFMSALWPLFASTLLASMLIKKVDTYTDF